jgi:hypothetical protein
MTTSTHGHSDAHHPAHTHLINPYNHYMGMGPRTRSSPAQHGCGPLSGGPCKSVQDGHPRRGEPGNRATRTSAAPQKRGEWRRSARTCAAAYGERGDARRDIPAQIARRASVAFDGLRRPSTAWRIAYQRACVTWLAEGTTPHTRARRGRLSKRTRHHPERTRGPRRWLSWRWR